MPIIIDPMREQRFIEMLSVDPSAIICLKNKFITDNMWKVAIESEPSLFQYMKEPSEEMVLFALAEDGANIKYLEEMGVTMTPKMIYTAVKNYPGAIFLIPESQRSNRLKEFACSEDPTLMKDLDLKSHYVETRLKKDPSLVRFVNHPTEEQYLDAIREDPTICVYIDELTPKMKELIKELYPEIIPLIPRLSQEFSEGNSN